MGTRRTPVNRMSTLKPNYDCPLSCAHRNSSMCVCNLIKISGEYTPISLGLRIGLNHVYAGQSKPPCLHGAVGSSYWSTDPGGVEADYSHASA
jgi:hypothetical protein